MHKKDQREKKKFPNQNWILFLFFFKLKIVIILNYIIWAMAIGYGETT